MNGIHSPFANADAGAPEPCSGGHPDLRYRVHLKASDGATIGCEQLLALSDADAIHLAMRRLERAAIVEVWRHARWVCSVERGPATASAGAVDLAQRRSAADAALTPRGRGFG